MTVFSSKLLLRNVDTLITVLASAKPLAMWYVAAENLLIQELFLHEFSGDSQ